MYFTGQTPDSWATFFTALKAAGRDFVVRPIDQVTAGELTAANTAVVDHVLMFHYSATRATAGGAAGTADATSIWKNLAGGYLYDLSLSLNMPVYMGVECDAVGADVLDYFTAVGTYLTGITKIGVFGPWRAVEYLHANSQVTYCLQMLDWMYGHGFHPDADLQQWYANYTLGGISGYKITATVDNFGQFRNNTLHPTAPSTVAPPSFAGTTPMGLVIRTGRPDEDLLLRIKSEDGKVIEYRAGVLYRTGGLVPRVVCADPSYAWDRVACEWTFSRETIGGIVRAIVENPSGVCATGTVCHIEEPRGSDNVPITLENFSADGKSVRTVLDDLAEMTGSTWCLVSKDGVWHFYFGHPANWPEWDDLRDDVTSDTAGTERRVTPPKGEIAVEQSNAGYANRVYYPHTISPPVPPPGCRDWDDVWTLASSGWKTYGNGVTIADGEPAPGSGYASVLFSRLYTIGSGAGEVAAIPEWIDLGFVGVPGPLCDMSSWYWGWLQAQVKIRVTTDQGIAVANIPRSIVNLHMALHSGSYAGPSLSERTNAAFAMAPSQAAGTRWTSTKWQIYGVAKNTENEQGETLFDLTNIHWIQLRAMLSQPRTVTALTTGSSWALNLWLDQMRPVGATAAEDAPTRSETFVESDAVTDGREQPVPMTIQDLSLPYTDAVNLANLALAENNRTRITVPSLPVVGMVDPPVRSRFPVTLSTVGIEGVSYGPVAIEHRPYEDKTYISVGDRRLDQDHADAVVRRMLDRTRAQMR